MRARRLLERKPSGKYLVDQAVTEQYKQGGEQREQLEMALLECLSKHGLARTAYKRVKVGVCGGIEIYNPNYTMYMHMIMC